MRDSNPRTPLVIESDWKLPAPVIRLGLSERSRTDTAMDARPYGGWSRAQPSGTATLFLMLALALLPRTLWSASACDLNSDTRIDVIDVQLGLNQALGISTCTSADLSGNGQCDIVDVQRLINAALGQECRVGPDASVSPEPGSQPWERSFTPQRTHYVTPNGSGNGSIGSPESFATARGHAQAGDRHILRGGTYTGNFDLGTDGSSSKPIEWKCYIDSNGDPEDAYIDGTFQLNGNWQWVNCLRFGDTDNSHADRAAVQMQAPGTAVINTIIQRHAQYSGLDAFNFGAHMVVYGTTLIDNGWNSTISTARHNTYTQNKFSSYGYKYFVQLTSVDVEVTPPNGIGRQLLHAGVSPSGNDGRLNGFHIQDSTFQRGRWVMGQHSSNAGNPPATDNILRGVWADSLNLNNEMLYGNQVPSRFEITDSLFRNTKINMPRHWGAGDGCHSYSNVAKFTGNELYDPPNGAIYVDFRARTYNGSCELNAEGAAKIRNDDLWNNNAYGRKSGTGLFNLHANRTNSGTIGIAAWRTATKAARESPSSASGFDQNSTEGKTPTTDRVECFANFYQPNWGKCRAIDFDGNGSITIPATEADKIIGNGKTYKVRNERNFRGTPLKSGTYTTGAGISSITVPSDAVNGVLLVWITSQP